MSSADAGEDPFQFPEIMHQITVDPDYFFGIALSCACKVSASLP